MAKKFLEKSCILLLKKLNLKIILNTCIISIDLSLVYTNMILNNATVTNGGGWYNRF
jgi:hypothetical protein